MSSVVGVVSAIVGVVVSANVGVVVSTVVGGVVSIVELGVLITGVVVLRSSVVTLSAVVVSWVDDSVLSVVGSKSVSERL